MSTTTHRVSSHVAAAMSVLLVWSAWNAKHGPAAGVLALPALIVMGDSTVDVGVNNFITTVVKADFPPYGRDFPGRQATGRFCDGKLINDVIAELAGYPPPYQFAFNDPNAEGSVILAGINTASAGSGFWDSTLVGICVPLSTQVQWVGQWKEKVVALVGQAAAEKIAQEAIYFFATGSNDWINNYYNDPALQLQYDKFQYTAFILRIVQDRIMELYHMGARQIGVVSLPPLGCVPIVMDIRATGGKCIEDFNVAASYFNDQLQILSKTLEGTLPGIKFIYLDSYSQVLEAVVRPTQYGIANPDTSDCCCHLVVNLPSVGPFCNNESPVCANADEYLWWDGFHPTQYFNQKVGELFFAELQNKIAF